MSDVRKLLPVAMLCIGCMHLPHVDPQPRLPAQANRATVAVEVQCGEGWGVDRIERVDWTADKFGTGVAISERHILTAAHVVSCPVIPNVHVITADGRRLMARVERDDATFGAGRDLARIYTLEDMGLGIAPPQLSDEFGMVTAYMRGGRQATGEYSPFVPTDVALGMHTRAGDSGAAVYDERGALIGIVTRSGEDHTVFEPVDSTWLEGT